MSRVHIMKPFHLDQKLPKTITLFLTGFGKHVFFREVLVRLTGLRPHTMCMVFVWGAWVPESLCLSWNITKGTSSGQRKKWNCMCYTFLFNSILGATPERHNWKNSCTGRTKSILILLNHKHTEIIYGTLCPSCHKPVFFPMQEKLISLWSDNLTLSTTANYLN